MSVLESNKVDGAAITKDKKGLVLLIADHLEWGDEYDHLFLLQEKINSYISYCENKEYSNLFDDKTIEYAIIEIHFHKEPTLKAIDFLNVVQNQIGELGIQIRVIAPEANGNEN